MPGSERDMVKACLLRCSVPGPTAQNELLLVNVTVPQTATSLTHISRLGRQALYIWDAHPSNPNRSVLLFPRGVEGPT